MTKETFVVMVQWLRKYKNELETAFEILGLIDPWECPLVKYDEMIDQLCAVGGLSDGTKEAIYDMIWDGATVVDATDGRGNETQLTVDEDDYWELFINTKKN